MKMDMRFIKPFVESLQNVFSCMVGASVTLGKPFLKGSVEQVTDIVAIVSLSGEVVGSAVLGFPKTSAMAISSRFSGESMAMDHPDLPDALGELINMVAGGAKTRMEGIKANISLPRVIAGKQIRVAGPKSMPFVVLPCQCDLGDFFLDIMVIEQD